MEYYSALEMNGVQTHAMTRMNLENIMQKERSQTQKATYCMIPFVGKSIETESRFVVTRDWGERDGEGLLMGVEFLFVVIKFWN